MAAGLSENCTELRLSSLRNRDQGGSPGFASTTGFWALLLNHTELLLEISSVWPRKVHHNQVSMSMSFHSKAPLRLLCLWILWYLPATTEHTPCPAQKRWRVLQCCRRHISPCISVDQSQALCMAVSQLSRTCDGQGRSHRQGRNLPISRSFLKTAAWVMDSTSL